MLKQLYLIYGEIESKIWTAARCTCEDTVAQTKHLRITCNTKLELLHCSRGLRNPGSQHPSSFRTSRSESHLTNQQMTQM